MEVFIPKLDPTPFATSFAQTAQQGVGPALELQFFMAQNAVQDRMDKEIEKLRSDGATTGSETIHLTRKIAVLTLKLDEMKPYAERMTANKALLEYAFEHLTELRSFADSSTVAEFDAKRAQTLDVLDKLRTAGAIPLGTMDDGLGDARAASVAALNGIVTNGFALPADIAAAQAAIDAVTADLTASFALVEINEDMARSTVTNLERILRETDAEKAEYEFAVDEAVGKVIEETRQRYANILTIFSISLDGAIALTDSFAKTLNFDTTPTTGTVIDFIS